MEEVRSLPKLIKYVKRSKGSFHNVSAKHLLSFATSMQTFPIQNNLHLIPNHLYINGAVLTDFLRLFLKEEINLRFSYTMQRYKNTL